jgi:large-conductance mechanosensitive channel
LLSIVTGLLVGGPLVSIAYNTHQASTSITCIAEVGVEHGKNLKEAYKNAYSDMTHNVMKIIKIWQNIGREIQKVFQPISGGINQAVNEIKRASNECRSKMSSTNSDCTRTLNEIPSKCRRAVNNIPFMGDVCSFLSVGTHLCDPLRKDFCYAVDVSKIAVNFVPKTIEDICSSFNNLFFIDVNLDDYFNSKANSSKSVSDIKDAIKQEFDYGFSKIKFIFTIIQYILIFPIVFVLFKAYLYLRKYEKNSKDTKKNNEKMRKRITKEKKQQRNEMLMQFFIIFNHVLLSLTVISFDFILY